MSTRRAETDFPIHDLFAERWSPRSFTDEEIDHGTLGSLLSAAQWAASAFNEQPWRFVLGRRGDEVFEAIFAALMPGNQPWAGKAAALAIVVAKDTYSHHGKPNAHAWYDCGQAVAQLVGEATAQGWSVHQMAGYSAEAAREAFGIPDDFQPVAAIAIGRLGPAEALPAPLDEREAAPRTRRPLAETVFGKQWEQASQLVD